VQPHEGAPLLSREQSRERAPRPLPLVHPPRLRACLIHREHERTVQELLVQVRGRGGEHDRHRSLHPVLLRHQPSRVRVLARACDREHALALQELERIARPLRALLLHHREYLVPQVLAAHVEEALSRHGRVLDALLFRYEAEHCVHERRLSRSAAALHDHRKRPLELPAHGRQVAHQLVGLLTDHPYTLESSEHAREQVRRTEQLECGRLLLLRELRLLLLGCQALPDPLFLQGLEGEQHLPQLLLQLRLVRAQLERGLLQVQSTLLCGVQVERVHVHGFALPHEQVHAQRIRREVLVESAHAVAPLSCREHDLALTHIDRQRQYGRSRDRRCSRRRNGSS